MHESLCTFVLLFKCIHTSCMPGGGVGRAARAKKNDFFFKKYLSWTALNIFVSSMCVCRSLTSTPGEARVERRVLFLVPLSRSVKSSLSLLSTLLSRAHATHVLTLRKELSAIHYVTIRREESLDIYIVGEGRVNPKNKYIKHKGNNV